MKMTSLFSEIAIYLRDNNFCREYIGARSRHRKNRISIELRIMSWHRGKRRRSGEHRVKGRPTDLTVLTKKNNGVFPLNSVYKIIDGRNEFPATVVAKCQCGDIVLSHRNTSICSLATIIFTCLLALLEPVVHARILAVIDYFNRIQEK